MWATLGRPARGPRACTAIKHGVRYKVIVRRVQTAERHVRAVDEESAAQKVQAERDRPYGFLGSWETIDTDMDIVAAESPLSNPPSQLVDETGAVLMSVKEAAAHLGIRTAMLYQLINDGKIAHVLIGSRRYVSRDQLTAFIEAHSHTGYQRSR